MSSFDQPKFAPKPEACSACPINHVTEGFTQIELGTGKELWVGETAGEDDVIKGRPFSAGAGQWLGSLLRAARIARSTVSLCNVIPCRPPDNVFPGSDKWIYTDRAVAREAIEYCKVHHLYPTIERLQPSRIVALGGEALRALTTRQGILQWRGSPLPYRGAPTRPPRVMPTLHPNYLMRQAGLFSVAVQDLKRGLDVPPEHYDLYPSLETVKAFQEPIVSFDFEWDHWGNVTMCGVSGRWYEALVIPFVDPYIPEIRRILEDAEVLIGHNLIDAEMKFIEEWGWKIKGKLHDTMLAQHLIQPDMRHGLGFVASVFTSKVFWKGQGEEIEDEAGNILPTGAQWKTWDSPDAIPREYGGYGGCVSGDEAWRLYNARDTDGTLQAEAPIFKLLRDLKLERVYWNISVPAAHICRDMNDTGLRIDSSRVVQMREEISEEITRAEQDLPEGLKPYDEAITRTVPAPDGLYRPKSVKCKGSKSLGTSHEPAEFTITDPAGADCPSCGTRVTRKLGVIKRIKVPDTRRVTPWNSTARVIAYAKGIGCKEVPHVKTGNSSGDKRARRIWGREHSEFTIVDALKKLATQRQSFAKEALKDLDRVKFRLAVTGTSEGRLSCSGVAPANLNLQNQPKAIRKIFIPDAPGYGILDIDVVQGENMLTAWLAKDWERWERLHTPGYDEHSALASAFFNKSVGKDDPLRKPGKIINHGRNYGLGERKTQDYLAAEGFNFSLGDVREMINIWKKENRRTAEWQQETIRQAQIQSYLENPFGRRRWFTGRDFATKALAFLPASTLADIVLRCMIAMFPGRFGTELFELRVGVVGEILPNWRMALQVHDSLVFTGPDETHLEQARIVKTVMEQPWPELDGFKFKVDIGYSTESWGSGKRIEV